MAADPRAPHFEIKLHDFARQVDRNTGDPVDSGIDRFHLPGCGSGLEQRFAETGDQAAGQLLFEWSAETPRRLGDRFGASQYAIQMSGHQRIVGSNPDRTTVFPSGDLKPLPAGV